jgi:hypothetical protein
VGDGVDLLLLVAVEPEVLPALVQRHVALGQHPAGAERRPRRRFVLHQGADHAQEGLADGRVHVPDHAGVARRCEHLHVEVTER